MLFWFCPQSRSRLHCYRFLPSLNMNQVPEKISLGHWPYITQSLINAVWLLKQNECRTKIFTGHSAWLSVIDIHETGLLFKTILRNMTISNTTIWPGIPWWDILYFFLKSNKYIAYSMAIADNFKLICFSYKQWAW